VALLTRGWHVAAAALFPSLTAFTEPSGGAALVALGTLVLFATNAALQAQPNAPWSQRIYQRLFAGLHLDERFTRLTFQVWPPRLPAPRPIPALTIQPNANEA
jgi:NAD(P)H-quinone oxidoreductase subunit 5